MARAQSSQRDQVLVVDDEVAHVVPFEVRDEEVEGVDHGAERLGLLEGDLVQVPAQEEDAEHDDEGDGGVGGGGGKDDGAEQDEGDDNAEHDPLQPERLEEVERAASGARASR